MRIAYLSHEPLPAADTSTEQLVRTLVELARLDFEIDLIVPSRRATQVDAASRASEIARYYGVADEALHGPLRVIELPRRVPFEGVALEAVHDVRSAVRGRRGRYELLYTRDVFALALALILGAPAVLETYRANLNTLRRFLPWRRLCYRRPNLLGVVTHSRLAHDSFLGAGLAPERLLLAYNGFAPELMQPRLERDAARRALGLPPSERLVLYAGHVGARKGTGALLEMARLAPELTFVLLGAVPNSEAERRLLASVREQALANVRLVARVPPPGVAAYLYAADCLIVPPVSEPLIRYGGTVLPMKTFLYLAAGRPILAPRLPDTAELLVDGCNARLVAPDAPALAVDALRGLLADANLCARLARQAQADAQGFTWKARAQKIAAFLRRRSAALGRA